MNTGDTMDFEPEVPKHDRTPNLKLVMNPEGKLHDWTDLPEEEVPELTQVAMIGNPEIAKTLVTNLNDCKGRGKVHYQAEPGSVGKQYHALPSFAGSFRQVFDSRRGIFEQVGTRPNTTNTQHYTPAGHHPLVRSKTLPDIPQMDDEQQVKRQCFAPPSPSVPRRTSSKQMVAKIAADTMSRRPLRNFFSNA